jgi:four helix bundle protein
MRSDKENLIVDLTFQFALKVISYCDQLDTAKKFTVSRQLLKCGTSIGANVREAQNAESKSDFIHKFKIAEKEADEAQYWILLCKSSKSYPPPGDLEQDIEVIIKVISKIVSSSKR